MWPGTIDFVSSDFWTFDFPLLAWNNYIHIYKFTELILWTCSCRNELKTLYGHRWIRPAQKWVTENLTIRLSTRDSGQGKWDLHTATSCRAVQTGIQASWQGLQLALWAAPFCLSLLPTCSLSHQHVTFISGTWSPLPALSHCVGFPLPTQIPDGTVAICLQLCASSVRALTQQGAYFLHTHCCGLQVSLELKPALRWSVYWKCYLCF